MKSKESKWKWNSAKEQAVGLVAEDRLPDRKIAETVGVTERTLENWKLVPEFRERVATHNEALRQAVLTQGIADRVNRVRRLDADWKRMQELIAARAADTPQDVPGASTGLVVRKERETKFGTVIEYAADTGLLAELRATEMQAAKELGQWTEKQEIASDPDKPFLVKVLKNVSMSSLRDP